MENYSSLLVRNYLLRNLIATITLLLIVDLAYAQGPYTADNDRSFTWPSGDLPADVCLQGSCGSACDLGTWQRREYRYSPGSVSVGSSSVTSRTSVVLRDDITYRSAGGGSPSCVPTNTITTTHNSNFSTVNFVNFESNDLTKSICSGGSVNLQSTLTYTSGVTWSGTGVNSSGVFSHSTAATYNPVATRVFDNGTSTITFTVTVNAFPDLVWSAVPDQCSSSTVLDLRSFTNSETLGEFTSLTGSIIGDNFNAFASTSGDHDIKWSHHTTNGCLTEVFATITVDAQNTVDAGANQEACENSGDVALEATTDGVT